MDTKGLFEIPARKLKKSGKRGLGKVNLMGSRSKWKKNRKPHGLLD